MAIMVAAMLFVPGMDAIAKLLSATVPPGQVAWARFFFQSAFLLPLMIAARALGRPENLGLFDGGRPPHSSRSRKLPGLLHKLIQAGTNIRRTVTVGK